MPNDFSQTTLETASPNVKLQFDQTLRDTMALMGRDRAQIVCVACHNRKVRCNRQETSDGVCKHCRRNKQKCVLRSSVRTRHLALEETATTSHASSSPPVRTAQDAPNQPSQNAATLSPAQRVDQAREHVHPVDAFSSEANGQPGYVGENSLLQPDLETRSTISNHGFVPQFIPVKESIIQLTEAAVLPRQALLTALTDSYFQHVFHRYPVVEREDLATLKSSVLLQQAICMAGSLMRHSTKSQGLSTTHAFYEKSKIMIFLNHEFDPLAVLSAICLMICWSTNNTDSLSLDCPWHWTGSGIRLATQMGLHRESTYIDRPEAGRMRRLWWILINADRLQAVCFARPLGIKRTDYDTKLPTTADFIHHGVSNLVFIQYGKLTTVMVEAFEASGHGKDVSESEIERLTASLSLWTRELPEEICLYDASGVRRPYLESVSELHILYFVTVILLEAIQKRQMEHWCTSIPALLASSSAIRLIEEIDCQEDVSSMSSATTWYIMVAAIPQLYYRPYALAKEELRQEELGILSGVIEQMCPKYGGANVVRRNIDKIRLKVGRYSPQSQEDGQIEPTGNTNWAMIQPRQLEELFPFPESLCPNMELLKADMNKQPDFAMTFLPFGNDANSLTFNEPQSCLDMFGINSFYTYEDSFHPSMGPFTTLEPGLM